jgi:hypothetical protein
MNDTDYTDQLLSRQTARLHELEDQLGIVRTLPSRIEDDLAPTAWENALFWFITGMGCGCWLAGAFFAAGYVQ